VTSLANYPGLGRLCLSDDELLALAQQGSLCQEQHRGKARYKLRFRTPGRQQIVRYVPNHLVEVVRLDLDRLQSNRYAVSALRKVTCLVRQARHDAKRQVQPVLDELGYHFHGTSIRRRRHKQFTRSFTASQFKEE
jgi:hypothetical protein